MKIQVFETISQVRRFVGEQKKDNMTIGFVPTMGCLHRGHEALIKKSVAENDVTVVSIFINPSQFSCQRDLERYPKTWENDMRIAEAAGANVIFAPGETELYPTGYQTWVDVSELSKPLCGQYRSGHFTGMATIVLKLFHITESDRAYFGQKDYQQVCIVKQMVSDLDMKIEIVCCLTVRENNGLALSSRNNHLTPDQKNRAAAIYEALAEARDSYDIGITNAKVLKNQITQSITEAGLETEYVEILDADRLSTVESVQKGTVIAVAAYMGDTRLIDNILI